MLLLARIFGTSWCRLVEASDDAVEVEQNLTVHFGESLLTASLGGGDQLQRLLALFVVLRQELPGGEEHRAGQTRVGGGAALLPRQAEVAVGQGLGGGAEPLLGPGCLGERTRRV